MKKSSNKKTGKMGKKSNQKFQRGRRSTAARAPVATTNADESYKARTLGMRDVTFTEGTAQDATRFEDFINKLARYVETQPWSRSSEVAKTMGELRAPVYDEPTNLSESTTPTSKWVRRC